MWPSIKRFYGGIVLTALAAGIFYFYGNVSRDDSNIGAKIVNIENNRTEGQSEYSASSLNGAICKDYNRRAFGVMMSEDYEARPLAGIGSADIVIEMPVVTGSITRMLALFGCNDVEEIGSVRSARHDFISIATGYDAILAHWGGSVFALEKLDKGAMDTLDALPNFFDAFYRKEQISPPHNGFTSTARMINAARNLGYRTESEFGGYKFSDDSGAESNVSLIRIGYKYPYNVTYEYSKKTGDYLRWRGGEKEIDKLTGKQVAAKDVVIMRAASRQIGGGYNDVDVLGGGESEVFKNEQGIKGRWSKETEESVLRFYDEHEREISFSPGNIWIEIVEPNTPVIVE